MHFLSPNSFLGRWLAFLLDALLICVAWALCSVPVITMGAATAALNRVAQNWMRNRSDCTLQEFFRAFKENWKGATVIWLILLVPGCVILFNINAAWFVKVDTNSVANWLILISGVLWIATAIYAFALQAAFENKPLRTVSNALRLVLVSPIRSLILVALFAGAIYCTYRFPFLVFVYTPFCVFLAARPVWGLFQKVMDLQEIPAETTNNSENEGE